VLAPTSDREIWACHAKATELEWEDACATRRVVARKPACTIATVAFLEAFLEAVETWRATLGNAARDAFAAFEARSAEGERTFFEAAKAACHAVATAVDTATAPILQALDTIATAVDAATAPILQALATVYDGNHQTSENGAVPTRADLE
jgi:hypothetical protein